MHYELKDLRLFQAIVETGNLSQGAVQMHMTASSASYRLKNLEYTVGSPLFLRTPKGMTLTSAGEVLSRHAKKLLADVYTMHAELGTYADNLRGSIRLIANSSSLNSFITPSLGRFLILNTSVNVDLKEQESPTIIQSIEEGLADIGVGAGLQASSGLQRELYAIDRLVCVVAPEHPMVVESEVSFQQILEHDLVSVEKSSSNFLYISHQAKLIGKPMRVRVHVQNFHSLLSLVQANVGAAIVPASTARYALKQESIVVLPITEAWAARELYLVHLKEPEQPDLVRQFAHILLNDPQVTAARIG